MFTKQTVCLNSAMSLIGNFIRDDTIKDVLHLKNIPFSFALILKIKYNSNVGKAIQNLNQICSTSSQSFTSNHLYHMNIGDINYFLYSCENEEIEFWKNGMYVVPNFGQLNFAGFAGVIKILRETSLTNDLYHPLFANIIEGDYLLDYYQQRIIRYNKPIHSKFIECYNEMSKCIKVLPSSLKPHYFHKFISLIVSGFENKFLEHIETQDFFLQNMFFRQLLLTIPQFLTPSQDKNLYLVSAGLPHFSVGCWKNWGRDTFISFNGVFLLTGLYNQGKAIILEYAKYLRHGLIPNMMNPSRYNSRDATWWFIYAIKNYLEEVGDYKILEHSVDLVYLSDNQEEHETKLKAGKRIKRKLIEIMQEIFQKHAEGINFREWNSDKIDDCMTDQGFNVMLIPDWKTGFIYGGNKHNCLTWMDKMGSSFIAKNRGIPATPRYGAPIELTALLYIGLKLMKMLYQEGMSPYKGIKREDGKQVDYRDWKKLIQANFEKYYWVPESPQQDGEFKIETRYVFRKGIYKDCLSDSMCDYQLRPNALIALTLMCNVLNKDYMKEYLNKVNQHLLV